MERAGVEPGSDLSRGFRGTGRAVRRSHRGLGVGGYGLSRGGGPGHTRRGPDQGARPRDGAGLRVGQRGPTRRWRPWRGTRAPICSSARRILERRDRIHEGRGRRGIQTAPDVPPLGERGKFHQRGRRGRSLRHQQRGLGSNDPHGGVHRHERDVRATLRSGLQQEAGLPGRRRFRRRGAARGGHQPGRYAHRGNRPGVNTQLSVCDLQTDRPGDRSVSIRSATPRPVPSAT